MGSVCSVGIVVVEQGEITDTVYSLIRPRPNFYSYWNSRIHGLTYHDTIEADSFPEVWEAIAPKIEGLPLIAHNSPFDEGCLRAVHQLYQMPYPDYRFLCTCRTARRMLPGLPNYKLHTVASYVGFDLTNHHNALADAEACAAIAMKIFW